MEKILLEKIEFTTRLISIQLSVLIGVTIASILFK